MISFKPATPDDISHIFALSQKLISTYEKEADLEIVFKWMKYKITQHIDSYQVIYKDDCKVGYFRVTEENELDDLYILERYQNQGIGSYVLQCISRKNMFLYVFNENKKAIALYERFGFKVVEDLNNGRSIMRLEG